MTPSNRLHSGIFTAAVLPLKSLKNSKQRLAPVFNAQQRAELTLAMLKDILHTLLQCRDIHKIFIVTDDPLVKHITQHQRIELLPEPVELRPELVELRPELVELMPEPAENPPNCVRTRSELGLTNAITHAGKVLAKQGIQRMLFIPSDVPLVSTQEIQTILNPVAGTPLPRDETKSTAQALLHRNKITNIEETLAHPGMVNIVPASASGGSNCISCMPADCMQFSFGEQSFSRHIQIARDLNLTTLTTQSPGLGLDVDTPEDLAQLAKRLLEQESDLAAHAKASPHSHTYRFLSNHGILNTLPPTNRTVESIRFRN